MQTKPFITNAFALCVISLLPLIATPVQASSPVFLVINDATHQESVPPQARAALSLHRDIERALQVHGYWVIDSSLVFVRLGLTPGRDLTPEDVIARLPDFDEAPIDGVVVFSLFASAERQEPGQRAAITMRLLARVLSAEDASELAALKLDYPADELPPLPEACDRDCVLEHIGEQTRRLSAKKYARANASPMWARRSDRSFMSLRW